MAVMHRLDLPYPFLWLWTMNLFIEGEQAEEGKCRTKVGVVEPYYSSPHACDLFEDST